MFGGSCRRAAIKDACILSRVKYTCFGKRLVRDALEARDDGRRVLISGVNQKERGGMEMSMGENGRRMLGLAVGCASLLAGGTAWAEEVGQPGAWEMNLQASGSPVMDSIMRFHDGLLVVITAITLFVLALLVVVVLKFNARSNPVPSRTT